MTLGGVLRAAGTSASLTTVLLHVGAGRVPVRTNFRDRPVSLAGGPAVAVGAALGAGAGRPVLARSALLAGLGCGALGALDDTVGSRPGAVRAKGLRGHVGALRSGRVSTGLVKLVGIAAVGLVAARPLSDGPLDTVVAGGIVAGSANIMNLLDLRPGRALKASLLAGLPLLGSRGAPAAAAACGAAAVALRPDLAEDTMLGDCGANALGALLGLAAVDSIRGARRWPLLAAAVALTLASERVSFSEVIARTPGLRELDALGRRNFDPAQA